MNIQLVYIAIIGGASIFVAALTIFLPLRRWGNLMLPQQVDSSKTYLLTIGSFCLLIGGLYSIPFPEFNVPIVCIAFLVYIVGAVSYWIGLRVGDAS